MPNLNDPSKPRRQAWSRYWEQGNLHSLPGAFEGNYAGAIGRFWQEHFYPLTAASRILDIGTGNGALPQLVCQQHAPAMPSVDAIDLVQVAPEWLAAKPVACREAVHFHGAVSAEDLPFPDHCFNLVVSQYGIEYSETGRSLRELARVLAAAGKVALIMHHHESRLATVAREELRLSEWLLAPDGFLASLEAALPWLDPAGSGGEALTPRARQARDAYDAALATLEHMAADSTVPDLLRETSRFADQAWSALRQQPAQAVLVHCYNYRKTLEHARLRYAELCQCALDEVGIEAFGQELVDHGLAQIVYAELCNDEGFLMGWTLTACKPE